MEDVTESGLEGLKNGCMGLISVLENLQSMAVVFLSKYSLVLATELIKERPMRALVDGG